MNKISDYFRKPKRNGAIRGVHRPGAIPPNFYDDVDIAALEEDWFVDHYQEEENNRWMKKKGKKIRKESHQMRRKNFYPEEEDWT